MRLDSKTADAAGRSDSRRARTTATRSSSAAALTRRHAAAAHEDDGRPAAGGRPLAPMSDETAAVVLRYQDLMEQFLEAQRSVVLEYLRGAAPYDPAADPSWDEATSLAPPRRGRHREDDGPVDELPRGGSARRPGRDHPADDALADELFDDELVDDELVDDELVDDELLEAELVDDELLEAELADELEAELDADDEAGEAAGTSDVQLTPEQLKARLLDLVSKRTGYPKDMLDLDLDLEGDLGIDSIKRVEILGTLAESLGGSEEDESALESKIEIEKLTVIRTLRGILEYLDTVLFTAAEPAAREQATGAAVGSAGANGAQAEANGAQASGQASNGAAARQRAGHGTSAASNGTYGAGANGANGAGGANGTNGAGSANGASGAGSANGASGANGRGAAHANHTGNGHAHEENQFDVQRALVRLVDAPLAPSTSPLIPSGTVLLTDDERGIAQHLAARLADYGVPTMLVRMAPAGSTPQTGGVPSIDLTDAEAVARLLDDTRARLGAISGLVHLLPLKASEADENWAARAARDAKSLYLLARGLETDLEAAGRRGGAFLLAGTGLDGTLGLDESATGLDESAARFGGVLGFTKCVALEWPTVLVRAVDVDPTRSAERLAEQLLAELTDREGPREIGYEGERRVTWEPEAATFDAESVAIEAGDVLPPGSTVLITGGARGITARIALELARRYQPRLVLVGRSALPADEEPAHTRDLVEAADIKAALIEQRRERGEAIAPSAIEAEYRRLLDDREIRENLAALSEAGAEVHYFALDVRDSAALAGLIADVTDRFGSIEGVIHGAGVIEDKLLRDKLPESFDRVFRTKVDSAATLARSLDPESLRFFVLFSSLASRYGNRGQSDYAAANEVLAKLAHLLDRRWPGRVVAIDWGPWSGVGMVAGLAPHLERRGLKLISPDDGPRFVVEELEYGSKGQSEVVIAGGAEQLVAAT